MKSGSAIAPVVITKIVLEDHYEAQEAWEKGQRLLTLKANEIDRQIAAGVSVEPCEYSWDAANHRVKKIRKRLPVSVRARRRQQRIS